MKRIFMAIVLCALTLNAGNDHVTGFSEHVGFHKGVVFSECYDHADANQQPTIPSFDVHIDRNIGHHIPSTSGYHGDKPLERMSLSEFEDYFHSASSAELFSKNNIMLVTSDAFVTYLKRFPEYEGYIEHFHEKFHKSSPIKKFWRTRVGKRLCQLHEEIKREKAVRRACARAAAREKLVEKQLAKQHAHLYEQWQQRYRTAHTHHKAWLAKRMRAYQKNDIVAVEQILQEEFATLNNAAAYHVRTADDQLGKLLVDGIELGTTALQKRCTTIASQAADFCWFVLDLIHAVGEGVVLAGYNTAACIHQVVCHPVETLHAFIDGVCAVADTLFIINDLPDQLREHDIPNKEHYYQKIADTERRLEELGSAVTQRVKEMKPRDWVKHGTAFIVEGLLLHKITQLTVNTCSRLGPLMSNLLRSVEYEEAVAMCVEGEQISFGGLVRELESTTTLMQQAENRAIKSGATLVPEIFATETKSLLSLLEELQANRIHHILQKKHMWHRLCGEPVSWDKVKEIIKRAIIEGNPSARNGFPTRVLLVEGETIEVLYAYCGDGSLTLTNAWVQL